MNKACKGWANVLVTFVYIVPGCICLLHGKLVMMYLSREMLHEYTSKPIPELQVMHSGFA